MPDQNDIVFEQYQIDLLGVLRALFEAFGGSGVSFDSIVDSLIYTWDVFSVLSLIFAAICLFGVLYAYIRLNQLSEVEHQGLVDLERLYHQLHSGEVTNTRWAEIEQHSSTDNPNDWKLAIIEADIMLDELLDNQGYAGSTIGEKLKSASPTQFTTIDDAWKAHRVRNQIAHQGADFILTKKLASETIAQYRRVFVEFDVI